MKISNYQAFCAAADLIAATYPVEDLMLSTPILQALNAVGIGPSRELVTALRRTADFVEIGLDMADSVNT